MPPNQTPATKAATATAHRQLSRNMAGAADFIQRFVHGLEAGGFAIWIRRGLIATAILTIVIYHMWNFRGLATSQAMDQAQIGREIVNGRGWRTNVVRPRAIAQLQRAGHNVDEKVSYDTYHAPLPSLVNAIALLPVKSHLHMTPRDPIFIGDKAIAIMSILLFIGSVVVLFFIARRLFDQRLALLACGLVLLCDMMWQFSLSGLPQMLMLLLFNATLYAMIRCVEAHTAGQPLTFWLVAVGAGFGLLALTHALTIWMFVAALAFCIFAFRPRWRSAGIVALVFVVIYTPWLVRTYAVSGNVGGVAIYSILHGIGQSEAAHMRSMDLYEADARLAVFRRKFTLNLLEQSNALFGYLGGSVVAMMFFLALLHRFKRREATTVHWMLLSMWVGALAGMVVYGVTTEQGVAANNLHLLFMPIMTCYGLAFLLVHWGRLDINLSFARTAFIAGLYLLCALPMIIATPLFSGRKIAVRWPPYLPPYVAVLNEWMDPGEVIASDMPWAVAWYSDRRALWLPETVQTFIELSDYRLAGGPINGIYLTPISGSQNTLGDILRGEYRDWSGVILRTMDPQKMPLRTITMLGLGNECMFLSDRNRQKPPP